MSDVAAFTLIDWSTALGSANQDARARGELIARMVHHVIWDGQARPDPAIPAWSVPDRLQTTIHISAEPDDLHDALGMWLDAHDALDAYARIEQPASAFAPTAASLANGDARYRRTLIWIAERAEGELEQLRNADPWITRALRRLGIERPTPTDDARVQLDDVSKWFRARAESETFRHDSIDTFVHDAQVLNGLVDHLRTSRNHFTRIADRLRDDIGLIVAGVTQQHNDATLEAARLAHNAHWSILNDTAHALADWIADRVELPNSPELLWDTQALIGPPGALATHDPSAPRRWNRAASLLHALQYGGVLENLRDPVDPSRSDFDRVHRFISAAVETAMPFQRPADGPTSELLLQRNALAIERRQGASRSTRQWGPDR